MNEHEPDEAPKLRKLGQWLRWGLMRTDSAGKTGPSEAALKAVWQQFPTDKKLAMEDLKLRRGLDTHPELPQNSPKPDEVEKKKREHQE
jgi:hypothetical protein